MAATKTKKRSIIIGGKMYEMPQRMSTMAYLNYLEVRDDVMGTEKEQRLYTKKQFFDIMDCIVELYGNQFTKEDMLDAETGMSPDEIIMEFALMDASISQRVDSKVEKFKENFTSGK